MNPSRIRIASGNHRSHINLIVHEIFHIMGVNFNCFKMYPSSDGKGIIRKNTDGRFFLVSENVVKEARDHFGCDSIDMSKGL